MKNPLLCRSRQSGTGSFSCRKEVQTDMTLKVDSLLAYTLMDMSRHKPLEEITVTDILRESGVSRTSFYSRFRDKNHLISWIYLNRTGVDNWRGDDDITPAENYRRLVRYYKGLANDAAFFRQACSIHEQNCLRDFMIESEYQFELDFFRKHLNMQQTDENILRKARYHATGQMHIIFSWLNDRNPLPPEEMAKWNIETKKALFKEYLDKIDEDVLTVVE